MNDFKMKNNEIRDKSNRKIGEIKNDEIRDSSNRKIASVKNDEVRDSSNRKIATIKEIRNEIDGTDTMDPVYAAALWLCLVKRGI